MSQGPRFVSPMIAVLITALVAPAVSSWAETTETASYRGLEAGAFLKDWLLLGSIPSAQERGGKAEEEVFAADLLSGCGGEVEAAPEPGGSCEIGGKEYRWRLVHADGETVDLADTYGKQELAIAYAWAEIVAEEETKVLLGVGSDDAVKVWLNGEIIHENRIGRPVRKDEDVVPGHLKKGRNRLLLKIQNQRGDWGFVCRRLDAKALEDRILLSLSTGDLPGIQMLLDHGVNVNARLKYGVTPFQVARILGYEEIAAFLFSKGAEPGLEMPPPEKVADNVLSDLVKEDSPGVVVLVARDGKVLFKKGYGYASLEHRVAATPSTKFRIGSITKQFTAAAVLQLQERGKLSVQDALSKFLPDFPRADEVRIHHLLTHTSGIHSYTEKPDFQKTVTVYTEPLELIGSFKNDPYDFSPGESWRYNNSGYFLLGHLIEKVSGESYADYLRRNLFEPVGMKDTGVHHWTAVLEHEATGYAFEKGKVKKALDWDMSRAGGAGALYSTIEDLYRWNEALFGGKVLSEESLKSAFTPVELKEGVQGPAYGYGWGISELRGLKEIGHGGGLTGFLSSLARYPDQKLTVAVLVNCSPPFPELVPGPLAQQIAQAFLWQEMKPRKTHIVDTTVKPDLFDDYVGEYDYGAAVLAVTKEGQRLFAQLAGQPKFEIFPKSRAEFFWNVVDAQVTFVRNDKGEVVSASHRQGGREFKAPKLGGRKVAEIDPALYDAYAGKYDYGSGAVLTVTKETKGLFAQLTGQSKFEILPSSQTEFFWKAVNARITFVKDESGNVVKAVHWQGERRFEAPRLE